MQANRWRKLCGKTFSGATPALSHRPFISRQIFDRSNGLPVRVVNITRRSFFVFAHSSEKADAVCPAGTPYAVCLVIYAVLIYSAAITKVSLNGINDTVFDFLDNTGVVGLSIL